MPDEIKKEEKPEELKKDDNIISADSLNKEEENFVDIPHEIVMQNSIPHRQA